MPFVPAPPDCRDRLQKIQGLGALPHGEQLAVAQEVPLGSRADAIGLDQRDQASSKEDLAFLRFFHRLGRRESSADRDRRRTTNWTLRSSRHYFHHPFDALGATTLMLVDLPMAMESLAFEPLPVFQAVVSGHASHRRWMDRVNSKDCDGRRSQWGHFLPRHQFRRDPEDHLMAGFHGSQMFIRRRPSPSIPSTSATSKRRRLLPRRYSSLSWPQLPASRSNHLRRD
jgi:hypothetical protein